MQPYSIAQLIQKRVLLTCAVTALACGLSLLSPDTAHAGVLYQTGFEPPTFTPGSVNGQDGWTIFGGDLNAIQVETSVVDSGTQALGAGPTSSNNAFHFSPVSNPGLIDETFRVMVTSPTPGDVFQNEFAFLNGGSAGGVSGGILISNVSSLGPFLFAFTHGFGTFVPFPSGVWNSVEMMLDFPAQTYDLWLNGSLIGDNLAFCGNICDGTAVPDYASFVFAALGNTQGASGYLDNLRIATVPEPITLSLFGAGLAGTVAVRRRRTKNSTAAKHHTDG